MTKRTISSYFTTPSQVVKPELRSVDGTPLRSAFQ